MIKLTIKMLVNAQFTEILNLEVSNLEFPKKNLQWKKGVIGPVYPMQKGA